MQMKRIFCLVAVGALALGMNAVAAPFGSQGPSVVVLRVGDGNQTLTNVGNTVFLDEYTLAAISNNAGNFGAPTPVQSIQMPTNWVGRNGPLVIDGTSIPNGGLSLSSDGRFLVLAGYGPTIGQVVTQELDSTTTTGLVGQVARVIALVDGLGHIYTTTTLIDANEDGNAIHSAVSLDGTNIWHVGEGASAHTGGKYTTVGSMISTQVEELSSFNGRRFGIFSNTLYYSANHVIGAPTNTSAAVNPLGGSLPTSFATSNFLYLAGVMGNSITNSPGVGSPYDFVLFNLNGGPSNDTLYVADNTTNAPGEPNGHSGGVVKYCYIPSSNAWVNFGYVYAEGATGLTGLKNGTNVTLYITEGGTATPGALNVMYQYVDTSGFAGNPENNPDGGDANGYSQPLDPPGVSAANINTRGIAFAPSNTNGISGTGTISAGAGVISVGPPFGPFFSGPQGGPFAPTNGITYSVANLGGASANYTVRFPGYGWLTATPSSGTLTPGASITVVVTANANAGTLSGGFTYTGDVVFHQAGAGGPVVASTLAALESFAFFITPSSNFVAEGEPGGPFTPVSAIYTLTNVTPTALPWTAFTSASWDTLSATSGTLPAQTGTNITVSIVTNVANTLAVSAYQDTLVFSNVTANAPLPVVGIFLQVGFGFFDNFSTYGNGNIDGQNGWYNPTPGLDDNPYQITNGVLVIPSGAGCANAPDDNDQEPAKNIGNTVITNGTAFGYLGMSVTVTSAPAGDNTWDFTIVPTGPQSAPTVSVTYNEARTSVSDNGSGQYIWSTHVNGFDSFVSGNIGRAYGVNYNVIIVSDAANSNCWVFVNPAASSTNANPSATADLNLFTMTPDAHDGPGVPGWAGPASPAGIGSIDIDNYCGGYNQAGYLISKVALSTNYTDVYNFLTAVAPPPDPFTSWETAYFTANGGLTNPAISGAFADADGTGMSNTNKFLAGFNPTNSAAYLHIISIAKAVTGGQTNVNVTYLGASGDSTYVPGFASRTNILEYSTGTGNGSYTNSFLPTGQTNILSGGTGLGVVTNMTDTAIPASSTRYYRVRVLLP
jgi:hypothetical protein